MLLTHVDSEDARAGLVREVQAMARLAHPNVVGIYDVGVHAWSHAGTLVPIGRVGRALPLTAATYAPMLRDRRRVPRRGRDRLAS